MYNGLLIAVLKTIGYLLGYMYGTWRCNFYFAKVFLNCVLSLLLNNNYQNVSVWIYENSITSKINGDSHLHFVII